jgi:hypothetical protein
MRRRRPLFVLNFLLYIQIIVYYCIRFLMNVTRLKLLRNETNIIDYLYFQFTVIV